MLDITARSGEQVGENEELRHGTQARCRLNWKLKKKAQAKRKKIYGQEIITCNNQHTICAADRQTAQRGISDGEQ